MVNPRDSSISVSDWQQAKQICEIARKDQNACVHGAESQYVKAKEIDVDAKCEWTMKPQFFDRATMRIKSRPGYGKRCAAAVEDGIRTHVTF